jgi:hypothetical protein
LLSRLSQQGFQLREGIVDRMEVRAVGRLVEELDRIRKLAEFDDHVIAAHDPKVFGIYPPARADLANLAVRVDLPPQRSPQ